MTDSSMKEVKANLGAPVVRPALGMKRVFLSCLSCISLLKYKFLYDKFIMSGKRNPAAGESDFV